jgi:hypothetical protein
MTISGRRVPSACHRHGDAPPLGQRRVCSSSAERISRNCTKKRVRVKDTGIYRSAVAEALANARSAAVGVSQDPTRFVGRPHIQTRH